MSISARALAACLLVLALLLAGCAPPPGGEAGNRTQMVPAAALPAGVRERVERLGRVAARVIPVAEAVCVRRAMSPPRRCDFAVLAALDPKLPPNAFQTMTRDGRPLVIFTLSMIELARNDHELAFVMGHEAAHHILGHIPERQRIVRAVALPLERAAAVGGLSSAELAQARAAAAREVILRYQKRFELEADALGAVIARAAGYDPLAGLAIFRRLPHLSRQLTHPDPAARIEVVRRVLATSG